MLSFNDLVTELEHLLPRRQLTAEELADIISKRHYLRRKAKESHARHGLKWRLNESDKVELIRKEFIRYLHTRRRLRQASQFTGIFQRTVRKQFMQIPAVAFFLA